jgi:hypothetical protein
MTFCDQAINAVMALTFISWPIAIIFINNNVCYTNR